MYRLASGPEPTPEQVQELDDTFLASDPFAYFCARINMLLAWAEHDGPAPVGNALAARFRSYLGAPLAFDKTGGNASDEVEDSARRPAGHRAGDSGQDGHAKDSQIAMDAFTLRHHAAEALLRLAAALGPVPCGKSASNGLWMRLADDRRHLADVSAAVREFLDGDWIVRHAVSDHQRRALATDERLASAVEVFGHWIERAIDIVTATDLDSNAANNKFKHGLAVRGRSDLRMTFTLTGPSPDGTIPVSALNGPEAVDIFDQPVVEFISRLPKRNGVVPGWELTQLRLDSATLLAESYMLSWTHAALYFVASHRNFEGRELSEHIRLPDFPGLPVGGPYPRHIGAKDPVGMRWPLTQPIGTSDGPRSPAFVFRQGTIEITRLQRIMGQVRVVEDDYWPQPAGGEE